MSKLIYSLLPVVLIFSIEQSPRTKLSFLLKFQSICPSGPSGFADANDNQDTQCTEISLIDQAECGPATSF